jgi:hypothetical protein
VMGFFKIGFPEELFGQVCFKPRSS